MVNENSPFAVIPSVFASSNLPKSKESDPQKQLAAQIGPCVRAKESLRLAVDVCPMDLRSKDLLSGRGHQVLLIPGLLEVRCC